MDGEGAGAVGAGGAPGAPGALEGPHPEGPGRPQRAAPGSRPEAPEGRDPRDRGPPPGPSAAPAAGQRGGRAGEAQPGAAGRELDAGGGSEDEWERCPESNRPGPGGSRKVGPSAAPESSFPMSLWERFWGSGKTPAQVLQKSSHPYAMGFYKALQTEVQMFVSLLSENEQLQRNQQDLFSQLPAERRLQREVQAQKAQISQLENDVQRLQQELKEAKRSQKSGGQKSGFMTGYFSQSATEFCVQVLATGQTGGCERQFLDGVSNHLANHRIRLQVDSYREDSGCVVLVFCPVVSRIGTDIENALEKIRGVRKALLVVLHHKPKDNRRPMADANMQAKHPAVVRTIHTRYTLQEGFYACPMNDEAVVTATEVIKHLSKEG